MSLAIQSSEGIKKEPNFFYLTGKNWSSIRSIGLKSLASINGAATGSALASAPIMLSVIWLKQMCKPVPFSCLAGTGAIVVLFGPIIPLGAYAGTRAGYQIANGILNGENQVELFSRESIRAIGVTCGGATAHIVTVLALSLLSGPLENFIFAESTNSKDIAKLAFVVLWIGAGAKIGDHLSKNLAGINH